VAINDVFPLKAARLDAITKLKFFWGLESQLQTNPMPFHLDLLWGATLMLLRACAMDWGENRILRVAKISGPIINRLWTKVRKSLGRCRGPLVVSNTFPHSWWL